MNRTAIVYALVSAALFGVSTPAAKLLLESTHPAVLAGLLYWYGIYPLHQFVFAGMLRNVARAAGSAERDSVPSVDVTAHRSTVESPNAGNDLESRGSLREPTRPG